MHVWTEIAALDNDITPFLKGQERLADFKINFQTHEGPCSFLVMSWLQNMPDLPHSLLHREVACVCHLFVKSKLHASCIMQP